MRPPKIWDLFDHRTVRVGLGTVVPEPNVARTMLMAGAGIGELPDFHAKAAIADGRLVRLLPDYETRSVEAHAIYRSHRNLSAKVRVFIDELVAHFAKRSRARAHSA